MQFRPSPGLVAGGSIMAAYFKCNYTVPLSFKVLEPDPGDLFGAFELRYFADYLKDAGKDCVSRHHVRHVKLVAAAGESIPASHFLASLRSEEVKGKNRLKIKNAAGTINSGLDISEEAPQVSGLRSEEAAANLTVSSHPELPAADQITDAIVVHDGSVRSSAHMPPIIHSSCLLV